MSRKYRYTILNSPTPSPLHRRHSYLVAAPLDIAAMSQACRSLIGSHDFASFTVPLERSTVRTISGAGICKKGELLFFNIAADSFLPQQVRRIVGSMVRVGLGRIKTDDFVEMLEAKRPGLAAFAAPARGLCLMKVEYPEFGEGQ